MSLGDGALDVLADLLARAAEAWAAGDAGKAEALTAAAWAVVDRVEVDR